MYTHHKVNVLLRREKRRKTCQVCKSKTIPSQICRKAKAAAAAQSSDVPIPFIRILIIDGNIETLDGAALSHFEYAPTSKHAEIR